MFMCVVLYYFVSFCLIFVDSSSDNLRENLGTLKIDFNRILLDVEKLVEDFIVQAQVNNKFGGGDIQDYNWNDNIIKTTMKSLEETLPPPKSKPYRVTITKDHLRRAKRSSPQFTPEKTINKLRKTFDIPVGNNYNDQNIDISTSEQKFDNILGQSIDQTTDSTSHIKNSDRRNEKVVCTTKTELDLNIEKKKLDDLKAEMQKLNELVSLLKDQQNFFRDFNIWERPKPKKDVENVMPQNKKTSLQETSRVLPEESEKKHTEKNVDMEKLKTDLKEALTSLNKTKNRESIIEHELNKQSLQIKFIQGLVNHIYEKNIGNLESKSRNADNIVPGLDEVEVEPILGSVYSPKTHLFDPKPHLEATNIPELSQTLYSPKNILGDLQKDLQKIQIPMRYLPKPNKLTDSKNDQKLGSIDLYTENVFPNIQGRSRSDERQSNSEEENDKYEKEKSVPRASKNDNMDLKLKLLELIASEDEEHDAEKNNDKVNEKLKKLLFPEKKSETPSDLGLLLNLVESRRRKKKTSKPEMSKLLKLLNGEGESRGGNDEIENDLKQLQKAINNLRPKDNLEFDTSVDSDGKSIINDDTSNFQTMLTKLLNKGTHGQTFDTNPFTDSLSGTSTNTLTPEQLFQLQQMINNNNPKVPGINPYTPGKPPSYFPQSDYNNFNLYNLKYPPSLSRPVHFNSYWSGPTENYKFNPNFLTESNVNTIGQASSPTYSQTDYNYPNFGYINFLKSKHVGPYENPNYKTSYNYIPANSYSPFANNLDQSKYLDTLNPWKADPYNGLGPNKQYGETIGKNNQKPYQFFPGSKQFYGDNTQEYEANSNNFIGSGLDQSYINDENTNQYHNQMMSDLTSQIQNLEGIIKSLNKPYETQTQNDKLAVWNLEKKISDLKGIINGLNSPRPYENQNAPEINKNVYLEKQNIPYGVTPGLNKPHYDVQQLMHTNNLNQPLYGPINTYQNPNSNMPSLPQEPKNIPSPHYVPQPPTPPVYPDSNSGQPYQPGTNDNGQSYQPKEAFPAGKETQDLTKNVMDAKIKRKERDVEYTQPFTLINNEEYHHPEFDFKIRQDNSQNFNPNDVGLEKAVDLFKHYLLDNITQLENMDNDKTRSNTFDGLQEKLNQLKAQLEFQKKGSNFVPPHIQITGKTFSKHQDIFESIVVKILDKIIGVLPAVMNKLFGNLVTNIGSSYGDYDSPLQKVFGNIGIFGYFPIILIRILETTETVIQYLRKNSFVKHLALPGISLALVAGVILFIIYFYQHDNYYGQITFSDYNQYGSVPHDHYKNQDEVYNKYGYKGRQGDERDMLYSNRPIPYSRGYFDYSPSTNGQFNNLVRMY